MRSLMISVLLALGGCTAESVAIDDWLDGAVLDPATPTVVFHDDTEELRQILWTGSHFAVLTSENIVGYVYLRLSLIEPSTGLVVESLQVTDPYDVIEDVPQSGRMDWTGSGFVVFWIDLGGSVHLRRVDPSPEGELELKLPVIALSSVGEYATLQAALPVPEGYALIWYHDTVPYFARVSPTGVALDEPIVVYDENLPGVGPRVTDVRATPEGFALLWSVRSVLGDTAKLIRLQPDGQLVGDPLVLYEAEDVITSTLAVAAEGRIVAQVWDLDVGMAFVEVDANANVGEPVFLQAPQYEYPRHNLLGEGLAAVLVGSGEVSPSNPINIRLSVLMVDRVTGEPFEIIPLSDDSEGVRCIEEYRMAPGGDSLGIVWMDGCHVDGRRLKFARLVPR